MNENEQDTPAQITPEDKALLLESVEAAQGYGECSYSVDKEGHEPCCVAAQYAVRKGLSLGDLRETMTIDAQRPAVRERLAAALPILQELQSVWDCSDYDEDRARAEMREIVNGWPVVGGEEG